MALLKPLPGPALPPPQRSPYHHGDLPSALKQAAVALIARHGVQGFSLREAAVAVGVSPSAAYRHYADKAALLGAVAGDALAEMGQRFAAATACVRGNGPQAARARFLAQGRAYVEFAVEHPERFAVMFGPYGAGSAGPAACAGHRVGGSFAALSAVLDELLEAGVIQPQRRLGAELLAWSAIHGLAHLLVSGTLEPGSTPLARLVERIGDDCLRALAAPDDRAPTDALLGATDSGGGSPAAAGKRRNS
jgi:AcrR family transcriptional regulator